MDNVRLNWISPTSNASWTKHLVPCLISRFHHATIGIASTATGTVLSKILLDTDVLIDHLRGHRQLNLTDPALKLSVVTRAELFAGRHVNESELRRTLDVIQEIPVDRVIAESAGCIRRTSDLPIADALIAATALEHGMSVMTRNIRHFARVPELDLCTPQT